MIKDTSSTFKGSVSKPVQSNRKLPRIPMNIVLPTASGGQVELLNYNYEYILVKNTPALEQQPIILLGEDLRLSCEQVGEQQEGASMLYRIRDWQKISTQPSLRNKLFALASSTNQAEVPATQELTA